MQTHYMLDEVTADAQSGHNVVQTVFVECGSMYEAGVEGGLEVVGETRFVDGVAAQSDSGKWGDARIGRGIISSVDLSLGADTVAAVLQGHAKASPGNFRGCRAWGWDADESPLDDADFVAGLEAFRERGGLNGQLVLEVFCGENIAALPRIAQLATSFPSLTIVLNHCGAKIGPALLDSDAALQTWRTNIETIAACPNVVCKVGGIQMEVNGFGFHEADTPPTSQEVSDATRPYYEHCIRAFGCGRCMFER